MDKEARLLILEDDPDDALIIKKLLSKTSVLFNITHVDRLENAIFQLSTQQFDLILTDLFVPDSSGLSTFMKIFEVTESPIVVLSGLSDEKIALEAVSSGAQDYLSKNNLSSENLSKVILYSIQRHQKQKEIKEMSFRDQLTGLYNRRGFLYLAEQQLLLLNRTKQGFIIFMMDLDHLKKINDTYGHGEGDSAIKKIAECMKKIFRKSDILARLGGDEFSALMIVASDADLPIIKMRLEKTIQECNNGDKPYTLSLSIGGIYVSSSSESCEYLMNQADGELYKEKKLKHTLR